ncbi:MAG: PD-(D/E)XK nuclease family protein [Victivallales bacterium]|nr:PD-(D/E)XK nuclease family protein [Victivallales bacterium]
MAFEKRELKNELTWSVSRANLFQECPRAYYYNYYGSWGGWDFNAPAEARLLYTLKNIQTMILWAGGIVHELIKGALEKARETGVLPDVPTLQEAASQLMNSQWLDCIHGRWRERPKSTNLDELYYGNGKQFGTLTRLPRSATDPIRERVQECLASFVHAPIVQEILATPAQQWVTIDTLDTFELEGIKIYCAIDFAFYDKEGFLNIIDWKTGNEYSDTLQHQLACYALYAMQKWNVPFDKIRLQGVILRDGGRTSFHNITQGMLDMTRKKILISHKAMKDILADPDNNLAQEQDFEPRPAERHCLRCNFRQVCPLLADKLDDLVMPPSEE